MVFLFLIISELIEEDLKINNRNINYINRFVFILKEIEMMKMNKKIISVFMCLLLMGMIPVAVGMNNYDEKIQTLKYNTARVYYDAENCEMRSSCGLGWGRGFIGPFGIIDFSYGFIMNVTIILLNGTINVKPLNKPLIKLGSGDSISMNFVIGIELYYDYIKGISLFRAFGVTIEGNQTIFY